MAAHADMDLISDHIEKTIGKIHSVFHEIVSDEIHLDVCYVKSDSTRDYDVLVTMGMSAIPMNTPDDSDDPKYIELIILLPKDWPLEHLNMFSENYYWPIRLLKDLARFAHHNKTYLGYAHTIANAENESELAPYAKNNQFCASILLPSVSLGEQSFILRRDDERDIYFFCVIPIFREELFFKLENGADELMDLFDQCQVSDIVDIHRQSAIRKQKPKFGISFEPIYGTFSFTYFDVDIDLFVVPVSCRVVVQANNEVVLDEKKFSTSHQCSFQVGENEIHIYIKQKNLLSSKLLITVSSTYQGTREYEYDMGEDPALEHLAGKNSFTRQIILGALGTILGIHAVKYYGTTVGIAFCVVFLILWWIVEYIFLRKNK